MYGVEAVPEDYARPEKKRVMCLVYAGKELVSRRISAEIPTWEIPTRLLAVFRQDCSRSCEVVNLHAHQRQRGIEFVFQVSACTTGIRQEIAAGRRGACN
jgi:hypothetical protein